MRSILTVLLLATAAPVFAQVATPDRPVTDPQTIASPTTPDARPVSLDDIGVTRALYDAVWSADGKQMFIATDLTGRVNIWRMDANGSWPVQLTQSDDAQSGLATTRDGQWLYFTQDAGGNEYYDIYRVPTVGCAAPISLHIAPPPLTCDDVGEVAAWRYFSSTGWSEVE
jgi:sugar lactone lactonase YvrE